MDLTKLKGKDLFYYLTSCIDDKEYSEMVALITYAIPDANEAFTTLENIVKDGKRLVAIYPGNGERPTSGMVLIGAIPDGALYVE